MVSMTTPEWRTAYNKRRRERRKKRREAGLCAECGENADGKTLCENCSEKNSARNIGVRARRKAKGNCPDCGAKKARNSVFCPVCRDKRAAYYAGNKDRLLEGTHRRKAERKQTVFEHYGLECSCCGENEFEFLTIDHINGGGNEHRRSINGCFYRWVIENGFPDGLQTLCYNCLVLNRNWAPVTFLPVRIAVCTVMRDMGSVLDTENYLLLSFEEWIQEHSRPASDEVDDEGWIVTPTMRILAPEIVVLKKYGERPPRKIGLTSPNLYRRDDHTCQYCGIELPPTKLTIDHVLPRSRGGPTTWENCVAACAACNFRKADRTPREARMHPKKKPATPRWKPGLRIPQGVVRASWEPFLAKERVA
jgi:hypothetical protein